MSQGHTSDPVGVGWGVESPLTREENGAGAWWWAARNTWQELDEPDTSSQSLCGKQELTSFFFQTFPFGPLWSPLPGILTASLGGGVREVLKKADSSSWNDILSQELITEGRWGRLSQVTANHVLIHQYLFKLLRCWRCWREGWSQGSNTRTKPDRTGVWPHCTGDLMYRTADSIDLGTREEEGHVGLD